MKRPANLRTAAVAALIAIVIPTSVARAQYFVAQNPSDATVIEAINAFNASMASPDSQIPRNVLATAYGIAIIPNTFRGAFVFGVQFGRGVLLTRAANGQWAAPRFIQIAGGNFGYQIGVQATDLILVFRSPQSVNNVLNGTLKVGVDASAAAGPYGRQASAGTDIGLSAEILSYSLARGAFIGASIDGSAISLDPAAEATYYQPPGTFPASALTLLQTVNAYSAVAPVVASTMQAATAATTSTGGWVAAGTRPSSDTEATRQQLDTSSRKLAAKVDDSWKQYLALPPEVYMPNQVPSPQATQQALQKYEDVAHNSQFAALHSCPEFQQTLAALRKMADVRTASNTSTTSTPNTISLPSPPVTR